MSLLHIKLKILLSDLEFSLNTPSSFQFIPQLIPDTKILRHPGPLYNYSV